MHCNWFQTHENVMDPYHVFILHGTFSGTQFTEIMNIFPEISWDFTDYGVRSFQDRKLDDGRSTTGSPSSSCRTSESSPIHACSSFTRTDNVAWTLPIDDTTTRIFTAFRMGPAPTPPGCRR